MMMMVVVVVVVTLMLTAVLVTVVGKSDSPRHWVSQVRGRGIERDQEGSRSENCHLLFIVDYPFLLVMYYLSDKKGAGLQIETLIHYVLNFNFVFCVSYLCFLSLFLLLSYLCVGLGFIWLCTSCRKQLQRKCASEQLSQNVAETQTPPQRLLFQVEKFKVWDLWIFYSTPSTSTPTPLGSQNLQDNKTKLLCKSQKTRGLRA